MAQRTSADVASVLARRGLTVHQRLAVHALVMSTTTGEALKLLQSKGVAVDRTTLNRWFRGADFRAAVKAAEEAVAVSITKHSVLRKTETLLEEAMKPRPILHKGEDTGFKEIELGTATRLVELQGKAAGLFQDESAMKIAVLVDVDFSGRKDTPAAVTKFKRATDAEFAEVPPAEAMAAVEAAAQEVLKDKNWLE